MFPGTQPCGHHLRRSTQHPPRPGDGAADTGGPNRWGRLEAVSKRSAMTTGRAGAQELGEPAPRKRRVFGRPGAPTSWHRRAAVWVVGLAAVVPAGIVAGAPPASATTGCRIGIAVSVYAPDVGLTVRIGDAVDYDAEVSLTANDCPISNGTVTLTWPNGTVQTLATGVSLAPGGY